MLATAKKFKFGWFGDAGLGERMIQKILEGRKSATCSPAYDPEDADLVAGDRLELRDKHNKLRGVLVVKAVESRTYGTFDEALAAREGSTLAELREHIKFANGRELRPDEDMRVVYFEVVR